ncbi:MAG: hypothetical protein HQM04_16710 [Magnetococcales bacterium]|nr:hypothetical protein [Magnetococcales bacterium]MBF0116672.1 hypothetical protein [Magnetococcales bacterium]
MIYQDLSKLLNPSVPTSGIVVGRQGDRVQVATARGMVSAAVSEEVAVDDRVVIVAGVARLVQVPTVVHAV